jgi:ABC-2 type transport system ATP-binding protein
VPALTSHGAEPAIVRTVGLSKRYGATEALRDLNLTVAAGEIYGFLGPNGAGKSTTVRLLLDQETPTAGTIELFGHRGPADPFVTKPKIGVVGEHQYLDDDMSAWEYLLFFGRLYGVDRLEQRASGLLERFHLYEFRRVLARDFSHGMQQKLGLARALLHSPTLLLLDEPVSGLDPHGIRQVREVLLEENQRGVTIIVMSHILSEVERTAHRVGILHQGRLVAEDSVAAIAARLQPDALVILEVADASPALDAALAAQPYIYAVDAAAGSEPVVDDAVRLRLTVAPGDHLRAISTLVAAHGGLVTGLHQSRLTLEEAFVRLTTDNIEVAAGRRSPAQPAGQRRAGRPRRVASPRRSNAR